MRYFVTSVLLLLATGLWAQVANGGGERNINQNFCNTLMGLVYHVQDSFMSLRGRKLPQSEAYECKHRVSGVSRSWIISIDGEWQYKGWLLSDDTSAIKAKAYYDESASQLRYCLPNAGYKLTERRNHDKHLADCPDLVYRHSKAPVCITLMLSHYGKGSAYWLEVVMTR